MRWSREPDTCKLDFFTSWSCLALVLSRRQWCIPGRGVQAQCSPAKMGQSKGKLEVEPVSVLPHPWKVTKGGTLLLFWFTDQQLDHAEWIHRSAWSGQRHSHHPPSKCIILYPKQACFPDPTEAIPSQAETSLWLNLNHGIHEFSLFYFFNSSDLFIFWNIYMTVPGLSWGMRTLGFVP